jgi:hypothetical protein
VNLVVLPENEEAVAGLGWQPYSVDRGFKAGENVVTVQSVVAASAPTYTGTDQASEHMDIIADVIGERACGYWAAIGMVYSNWHPLIVLGPGIAQVFAQDPERLIPVFQRPEWIGIVVAGDWGRNQSKGYVCNHVQGVPTSRRVVLPRNWEALLASR